jgi:L-2-hydroxyglutarate oxidase LhgO
LELLLRKSRENNTEIKCDSGVKEINKKDEIFEVITLNNEKYYSEKIVITCG